MKTKKTHLYYLFDISLLYLVGAGIGPYGRLALWLLLINYSIKGEKRMRTYKSVLKMFLVLGLMAAMA
ncbi:MAG: hypothetical protein PVH01_17510, partial [Desulfobacterales bacterium]